MKLHLPSLLRKALLTCMAAVSGVAVSAGTGSLVVGSAFVALSSSSVAYADSGFVGPVDEEGNPLIYIEQIYKVDTDKVQQGMDWMTLAGPQDEGYINYNITFNQNIGIRSDKNTNLKLTLTGSGNDANRLLTSQSEIHSKTLWVSGSKNSLAVGQGVLTKDIETIYADSVALQFVGSYQGENELNADFVLGRAGSYVAPNRPALNNSALVLGSSDSSNVIRVTTTGGLCVGEDSPNESKIGFYTEGSSFTVKGAISGSGTLRLGSVSDSGVVKSGSLYLMGGSDEFTGAIRFDDNGANLYFGQDIELGGLGGAAQAVIDVYGVDSVNLTLNVTEEYVLGSANANSDVSSVKTFGRGIFLTKIGAGSQTISNFSGSGVDMQEGTLTLNGRANVGSDGVEVTGGTLNFTGSDTLFNGGLVHVSEGGTLTLGTSSGGSVSMGNTALVVENGGKAIANGPITFAETGSILVSGGSLSLLKDTNLGGADLTLAAGSELIIGGMFRGLHEMIEVDEDVSVTFRAGTTIDVSSLGEGEMVVDVKNGTFSYKVDVLRSNGGTVSGWTSNVSVAGGFTTLAPTDGVYSAGLSWANVVTIQSNGTQTVNWRNDRPVEDVQVWHDSDCSLAVTLTGSVMLITGENSTSGSAQIDSFYKRTANNIFIAQESELVLRQARITYENGEEILGASRVGNVQWHNMMLMGTLVLQDKNVLVKSDDYQNAVSYDENHAKIIVDWRFNGKDTPGSYSAPETSIGTTANLPTGYEGDLVVRSGVLMLTGSDHFRSVTVESGGQITILNTDYTGDITLTGTGLTNMAADANGDMPEVALSAMKVGGNGNNHRTNRYINGNVTISNAAAIHAWAGEYAIINGDLLGVGLGEFSFIRGVNNGTSTNVASLYVEGMVSGIKLFHIDEYASVEIRSAYDASQVDTQTAESRRFNILQGSGSLRFTDEVTGFDHFTVSGLSNLEITSYQKNDSLNGEVVKEQTVSDFGEGLTDIIKDGSGSMLISRNILATGKLTINGGTFQFGELGYASYGLKLKEIEVGNNCAFTIYHTADTFETNITLNDGTLSNMAGYGILKFGTLTVAGGNSFIEWAPRAQSGDEGFVFERLTGTGDLHLEYLGENSMMADTVLFEIGEIVNFAGTLSTGIVAATNISNNKRVVIGTVHQDYGTSGAITMTPNDSEIYAGAYVTSSGFRKTGLGSFTIDNLALNTEVWMNYEGTLNLTSVKFANKTILHYTTGREDQVILSQGVEDDDRIERLYVDILDLSNEQLASGVNLGFYANMNDTNKIKNKLIVGGIDQNDYRLEVKNGRIYLYSEKGVNLSWDRAMGVISMAFAPTQSDLNDKTYRNTLSGSSWTDSMIQLARESGSYATNKQGQLVSRIQLANSSGGEYATVVGGRAYFPSETLQGPLEIQTYIFMAGGDYHLLVGGSTGLNFTNSTTASGIIGGSHIQVQSGEVDYIVAGNHLSSGGLAFDGDSYVSFQNGTLKGGIIGGNTYAGGGGGYGLQQKSSSNIFIYTALANVEEGETTPTIGVPEDYVSTAAPFTKIVGGSAYVSDGARKTRIAFQGDSTISVNLSGYAGESSFDKDIIGGNAYLVAADLESPDAWSSTFIGDSNITILGKDKAGQDVLFQGMVVGGTHHDASGSHEIIFEGDTHVNIRGGQFTQAVVGGLYEGALSAGIDRENYLQGDTYVTIDDGSFWRVVGGSYVLSLGEGASYVDHYGDSYVEIHGGSFANAEAEEGATTPLPADSRSVVVGGSFYSGNASSVYNDRTGSSNLLVTGGSFTGSILIGGDYVDATTPEGAEGALGDSVINRGTNVSIAGATITDGFVVGASYMTDEKQDGNLYVEDGSHVSIEEGTKIVAGSAASMNGVGVVGGHYLDVGGSWHAGEIYGGTEVAINGGSVSGIVVGGSALTGYINSLYTDVVNVAINGGTVEGDVYGGHYVGAAAVDPDVAADTEVTTASVTINGGTVTGNVYGGGYFACSAGMDSNEYVQMQGDITVSLLSGTLSGNVYAAGKLTKPSDVAQDGDDTISPDGARVITESTRVEVGSAIAFGHADTLVSGGYHLAGPSSFAAYNGSITEGARTLAFTDSGDYSKIKNWAGVSFVDFDTIEVVQEGWVSLSESQFTGADTGFTKAGEGTLLLQGSLPTGAPLSIHGGTLILKQKQNLSGGLHFDLTGRSVNTADTCFLQGLDGYVPGAIDVYLDGDNWTDLEYGTYYLASNWDSELMDPVRKWLDTDTHLFVLAEENGCLVLHVTENSNNPWLWRGNTNHSRVGAFEWDSKYPANWNAHQMDPNCTDSPDGKDLLFTASAAGEVKVGELVHPSSVTVKSGNYTFVQRSADNENGVEGIWTDRLTVGGSTQAAVLHLKLDNRNINNVFLEANGTLILDSPNAITSSIERPQYNSIIYSNGGTISYGENFGKDVSWQISQESTDIIRVDVDASHVKLDDKDPMDDESRIVWGRLYDSTLYTTLGDTNPVLVKKDIINNGLYIAMTKGIVKTGEGTLHLRWQESTNAYYEGDISVQGGKLEIMINGGILPFDRKFYGKMEVAAGAELVFSAYRSGYFEFREDSTFSGEGTIVIGRQLGDDPAVSASDGHYTCTAQGHGGKLSSTIYAPYQIFSSNSDFAGTLVLEGNSSRSYTNFVTIGGREGNGAERDVLYGYDATTGTLTALGGGQTTLVLAGRHLTIDGLVSASSHPNVWNNENGQRSGRLIDPNLLGEKFIRAGIVEVVEDTVTYVGSTAQDFETDNETIRTTMHREWDDFIVFTGKITGSGTLAIPYGCRSQAVCSGAANQGGYYTQEIWGSLDEFTGYLVAGDRNSARLDAEDFASSATWNFVGSSASGTAGEASVINATLAGDGYMYFYYTQDTLLAAPVGDVGHNYGNNTWLVNDGTGKIIIGSNRNTSVGRLIVRGGGFDLGDVDHYANWISTDIAGDGFFTLVNGELRNAMVPIEGAKVRMRVETSVLGATTVNAGGTLGSDLYDIIINKGGFLSGVNGDITVSRDETNVKLVFSKENVGSTAEGQHLIELRFSRSLIVQDPDFFLMDFGVDSIVDLIKNLASEPQSEAFLHVLSKGTLKIDEGLWDNLLADGGDGARLLSQLGMYIERIDGGEIVMKAVGGHRAYRVFSDPSATDAHTVTQYDILSGYDAVVVEKGNTLNIELSGEPSYGTRDYYAGGAVVPNLWGDRDTTVNVTNKNTNRGNIKIVFDNSDPYDGSLSSVFQGTINGGEYVDFEKTGTGSLTIGYHDNWNTSGGFHGDSLNIKQGGIFLLGRSNTVRDTLTFSYDAEPVDGESRGLVLMNGETTIGSIVEGGTSAGPIILGNNARLLLDLATEDGVGKENVWNDIVVMHESDQSTGLFTVNGGSLSLTNEEKAQLVDVHLNLDNNAQVSINCLEGVSLASLAGDLGSVFHTTVGGVLEVGNKMDTLFCGTLSSDPETEVTMHLAKGVGTMTMRNVKNPGNWHLHNEGNLVIDVSGKYAPKAASNNIALNKLTLGQESKTTYIINADEGHRIGLALSEMLTAADMEVGAGATFTIDCVGSELYVGSELTVANVGAAAARSSTNKADGLLVELIGYSFLRKQRKETYVDYEGNFKIIFDDRTENPFLAPNMENNARAGADLFWDATAANSRIHNISESSRRDLVEYLSAMDHLRQVGNTSELNKALAAGAGASTSVLGPALAQDMQRQLRAIRNRTTTMGANQSYVAGSGPAYHAWINGEGNYHKMEADGLAPGYKLSSWGGTLGMDADVSNRTTFGLALTAMYGTLTPDSADKAEGKLDTYYLNFFGKTSHGRWMHTFVGSIGLANVSLDRTVTASYSSYGEAQSSSYKTNGSTNGYAFGLMYEVGYAIPMNEEASYALQPVANVTLRHVGISGYEESGSGAGLRVGDSTQTIFTLGAGVRAQAVVGENVYNRTSILEGRVLVKLDAGDKLGSAENSLINGAPTTAKLESAELGAVGLEVGLGITIPMEAAGGSIFMDASAEIRSGYTNMNATVGYRMDF